MPKNRVPKPHQRESLLKGISKINIQDLEKDFFISFKYLDRNQGQTFEEWEQEGILARSMEVLRNYCCNTLCSQNGDNKFTIYKSFPLSNKTKFQKPNHVPEDAEWARIHVSGLQIICGYINRNVFNVVFLDKDHDFYISEKKHT